MHSIKRKETKGASLHKSISSTGLVQDNIFNIRQRHFRSNSLGISCWASNPTHFTLIFLAASVTAGVSLTLEVVCFSCFSSQPPVGRTRCWTLVFLVVFFSRRRMKSQQCMELMELPSGAQCWSLHFSSRLVSPHGCRVQRRSKRSAVEDHDNEINGG